MSAGDAGIRGGKITIVTPFPPPPDNIDGRVVIGVQLPPDLSGLRLNLANAADTGANTSTVPAMMSTLPNSTFAAEPTIRTSRLGSIKVERIEECDKNDEKCASELLQ